MGNTPGHTTPRADCLEFFQVGWPAASLRPAGKSEDMKGTLFCALCAADRTHKVLAHYLRWETIQGYPGHMSKISIAAGVANCLQCGHITSILTSKAAVGEKSAVLGFVDGGISTPATPDKVKYFLDQATKAGSAGAYSAALTMIASALETVLSDAGYKMPMLGAKIGALLKDLESRTLPEKLNRAPPDFLKIVNDVGKDGRHSDRVEIADLKKHDKILYDKAVMIMVSILDEVYERDARLKTAAEAISKYKEKG